MNDANLVEAVFSKNYHFESGILCTYGLNLNFFENYLLKLDALYSCDDICLFTDSSTYDSFIKDSYTPRWFNKKYLVNRIKTKGVFHTKLYMFASEKKALIGIGSANLTRDGIASNLELLSIFEISEKDKSNASLLRDCIEYVRQLASITQSKNAIEKVDNFSQLCKAYLHADDEISIRFIDNLNISLLDTIKITLKDNNIHKIQVVSPFYDTTLAPLRELKRAYPSCNFEIYLQQNKSNFPKEVFGELESDTSLFLYKNVDRYIHGKAMLFHTSEAIFLFTGSANFTQSALMSHSVDGNYEIGLIGQIDQETADNLICPSNIIAKKVDSISDIDVNLGSEFEACKSNVEYIVEAVLTENIINVTINPDITIASFAPERFKILDFNGNTHDEIGNPHFAIEITPAIRKKVPGKLAIQIIGRNELGTPLESNISWVIELEDNNSDPMKKRFRRIYNDPFELYSVLHEIMMNGDEGELRLFLLTFDIPLDLMLPPRNFMRAGNLKSKGNVEGVLPPPTKFILSAALKDVYSECLNRLYRKLEHHAKYPQINKITNFFSILSSLYLLIEFINTDTIYDKFKNAPLLTAEKWSLIRDYYDMLLRNIDQSWQLIWADGGYRDLFNAKISKDLIDEQQSDDRDFEKILREDYQYTFKELVEIAMQTLEHFEELKTILKVQTVNGMKVKPEVFPGRHRYLQPNSLNNIKVNLHRLAPSS
jgi:HKD family nuclease